MCFPLCLLILLQSNYLNQERSRAKLGFTVLTFLLRVLSTQQKVVVSLFITLCTQQCYNYFLMIFHAATDDCVT